MLRDTLLPSFDQTYSTLMEDLDSSGCSTRTLVVRWARWAHSQDQRRRRRDHWTFCYSVLWPARAFAGGTIHGASDDQAAFIKDKPVHIRDICATIYHLLGIDPEMLVQDTRRPGPFRWPWRSRDRRNLELSHAQRALPPRCNANSFRPGSALMNRTLLRDANVADLPAINAIYNYYVLIRRAPTNLIRHAR